MEAYPLDLRGRIAQASEDGLETREEMARRFGVSVSFITKLLRREREQGTLAPKPRGGGRKPTLAREDLSVLARLVRQQPDATIEELCERVQQRCGLAVSRSAMGRYLLSLDLPRKKKLVHASERDTPRVRRLRRQYRKRVAPLDAASLVFPDESGVTTGMTRLYGRALPGERVVDAVPQGNWRVTTLLGALRLEGIVTAATIPAATDTAILVAFVRDSLVPTLRPGDVVVWDNLGAHRAAALPPLLEEAGARLLPLPPYSPDFSPMEPAWSKIKQFVRSAKPQTDTALLQAVLDGFHTVTAEDAQGWFRHCGYVVQ